MKTSETKRNFIRQCFKYGSSFLCMVVKTQISYFAFVQQFILLGTVANFTVLSLCSNCINNLNTTSINSSFKYTDCFYNRLPHNDSFMNNPLKTLADLKYIYIWCRHIDTHVCVCKLYRLTTIYANLFCEKKQTFVSHVAYWVDKFTGGQVLTCNE